MYYSSVFVLRMLEQCTSCWCNFYHWSSSSGEETMPLWNWCITPLEVHEYNEGLYQLHMHRLETEHVRVVSESQQVNVFFQLSFVLVVKRRCLALLAGCTTTLAVDGYTCCTWVKGCYSVSAECVRANSVSVSSGKLVYDSQAVPYNLK